jgi:Uma2 family endonuclease
MPRATSLLVPPLRDGDRLTSDEFMRRWEAMPDVKLAELIDGVVYLSPLITIAHSEFHFSLSGWIGPLVDSVSPALHVGISGMWLMGERDTAQPDIHLCVPPGYGGQSQVEGDYALGAPELIIEVSSPSRNRNIGLKSKLYERIGVREHVVAFVEEQHVIWNELVDGKFQPIEPDSDGIMRSRFFRGLWLDPTALWHFDLSRLVAVAREGVASPEHAAFVARLARK